MCDRLWAPARSACRQAGFCIVLKRSPGVFPGNACCMAFLVFFTFTNPPKNYNKIFLSSWFFPEKTPSNKKIAKNVPNMTLLLDTFMDKRGQGFPNTTIIYDAATKLSGKIWSYPALTLFGGEQSPAFICTELISEKEKETKNSLKKYFFECKTNPW